MFFCFQIVVFSSWISQAGVPSNLDVIRVDSHSVPRWAHYGVDGVDGVVFSPKETRLASYGQGLRIWDVKGRLLAELNSASSDRVSCACFLGEDRIAAVFDGVSSSALYPHLFRRVGVQLTPKWFVIYNLSSEQFEVSQSLPSRHDSTSLSIWAVGDSDKVLLCYNGMSKPSGTLVGILFEETHAGKGEWNRKNWSVDGDFRNPQPCQSHKSQLVLIDGRSLISVDVEDHAIKFRSKFTRLFVDGFMWASLPSSDTGLLYSGKEAGNRATLVSTKLDWWGASIPPGQERLAPREDRFYYRGDAWFSITDKSVRKFVSGKTVDSWTLSAKSKRAVVSKSGALFAIMWPDQFRVLGTGQKWPVNRPVLETHAADFTKDRGGISIVRGSARTLTISRIEGDTETIIREVPCEGCQLCRFSDNGESVLFIDDSNVLWVIERKESNNPTRVTSDVSSAAFSDRAGTTIISCGGTDSGKVLRRRWLLGEGQVLLGGEEELDCLDYSLGIKGSMIAAVRPIGDEPEMEAALQFKADAGAKVPIVFRVNTKIGDPSHFISVFGLEDEGLSGFAIDSARNRIAVACDSGRLQIVELSGDILDVVNLNLPFMVDVRFSKQGDHLILTSGFNGFLEVYSISPLESVFRTQLISPVVGANVFSAKSPKVLVAGWDCSVVVDRTHREGE